MSIKEQLEALNADIEEFDSTCTRHDDFKRDTLADMYKLKANLENQLREGSR